MLAAHHNTTGVHNCYTMSSCDGLAINPQNLYYMMIFDGMAVLQSMTKIIHFKDAFINRGTHLMKGVVFDSSFTLVYLGVTQVQNSMKNELP